MRYISDIVQDANVTLKYKTSWYCLLLYFKLWSVKFILFQIYPIISAVLYSFHRPDLKVQEAAENTEEMPS